MNTCERIRKNLARFLDGELSGGDEDAMKKHLGTCPECRRILSEMGQILAGAEAVHDDIRKVMASIDWEALPARIANAAWRPDRGRRKRGEAVSFWKTIFSARWRPLLAGRSRRDRRFPARKENRDAPDRGP